MKVIGKRISVLKKENLLSIVILPLGDKKKLGLMFLWLLAWSSCGIIVFLNYFRIQEQNTKLFVIVYLSFWAYFEFKIVRAYSWKRWGKEKIWVQNGVLHYQKEVNGKGKIAEYNSDMISDLKLIEVNDANFSDFINQSFWIKGGERIEFTSQSKNVRLAMQLTDEEARSVLKELKEAVS